MNDPINIPLINVPVLAVCKRSNGEKEEFKIRRIKSKGSSKGWQWSGTDFDSYFTLEVVSWRYITQLSLF
jgi:hypothetical protein